jgi:hypothetical protein
MLDLFDKTTLFSAKMACFCAYKTNKNGFQGLKTVFV